MKLVMLFWVMWLIRLLVVLLSSRLVGSYMSGCVRCVRKNVISALSVMIVMIMTSGLLLDSMLNVMLVFLVWISLMLGMIWICLNGLIFVCTIVLVIWLMVIIVIVIRVVCSVVWFGFIWG